MTKYDKAFLTITSIILLSVCATRVLAVLPPDVRFQMYPECRDNHASVRTDINVIYMESFFKSRAEVAFAMQQALSFAQRSCNISSSAARVRVDMLFFVDGCRHDIAHAGVVATWLLNGSQPPQLTDFKNRAGGPLDFPLFEQRERHERIAALAISQREMFIQKNNIAALLTVGQLQRNPFLYENKVVGLAVFFEQMVAKDRAIFQEGFGSTVTVSGVPTTRFASSRPIAVALAVKVLGTKKVATPFGGEQMILDLEFVDAIECGEDHCRAMFGKK